jgi:nucleoside-diphosphate-sugar epimerase/uncharacterized membrane protein
VHGGSTIIPPWSRDLPPSGKLPGEAPAAMTDPTPRPLVLVTGAAGNLGAALAKSLTSSYRVVGLDRAAADPGYPIREVDLTSDASVAAAMRAIGDEFGRHIASVVHFAAYFDFSGEDHPLYRSLNVEGTHRLLRALQSFDVAQFVYAGTMLVHRPCRPGERIDESRPIDPRWAYPKSKAAAEEAIRQSHGNIPYVLLHLAGIYDSRTAVPTLSHQIARIYEQDFQSYLYSGDLRVGQSMLHKNDMVDAFRRVIDRRDSLPQDAVILVGEPDAIGYDALQDEIGALIYGAADWPTLKVPKGLAAIGAWTQEMAEPVIPDSFDEGEKPFVRPFMVTMADDHYALDISRAEKLLGWRPAHSLKTELPRMIAALKADPLAWYGANKVPPPTWLRSADSAGEHPESIRARHHQATDAAHRAGGWAHLANMALATWLIATPPSIGIGAPLAWSDRLSGILLLILAAASLSPRLWAARWACAAIGLWVLAAPMLFWTPSAAAYLNGTLVGALIIGFAVCLPPEPGVSPAASASGPEMPPGWSYNPSEWSQRLPIIALALLGLYISRYLAAYQLGHVEAVWDPIFMGGPAPANGTEEIITSSVSRAWPVPDAAVGALTYILEIITGIVGGRTRWRTMPWLVVLFGLMIVPLGIVSIAFIIIQPIVIGTWCALCLIGAAAMLIQIPYSIDELLATCQFLRRRRRLGQPLLRIFFTGDTDIGDVSPPVANKPLGGMIREALLGGVSLPWNLSVAALIGGWLMLTRITLGNAGSMAHADHLIGALVLTVIALAAAEMARMLRFLLIPLGAGLLVTPFLYGPGYPAMVANLLCGVALIILSLVPMPAPRDFGRRDSRAS